MNKLWLVLIPKPRSTIFFGLFKGNGLLPLRIGVLTIDFPTA